GDRRAPAARAGRTSRSRRRADRRGVRVSPGRRRGRGGAHPRALRNPGGAAEVKTPAVPRRTDTADSQLARFAGTLGGAGERLVEHEMGWPAGYFLWCWENPHPERAVERLEFIPHGGRFIVAGITTSDVDEHPFVRAAARPVRLVAKDGRNGVLDVEMD